MFKKFGEIFVKNYLLRLSGFSIVWLAVLFFFGVFTMALSNPVSAVELSPTIDDVLDYVEIPSHIELDPITNKEELIPDKTQIFRVSNTLVTDDPNEEIQLRTYNTKFYSDNHIKVYGGMPFYFDKSTGQWRETEYITMDKSEFQNTIIQFTDDFVAYNIWDYLIQTVYAQTYSGSGDGGVMVQNASYSTAHDATTGTAQNGSSDQCYSTKFVTPNYYVYRAFLPFDTSALSDTDCITNADLFIKTSGDQSANQVGVLVEGTQASTDTLVGDDFNNYNITELADRLTFGTTNTYYSYNLNQDGYDLINRTGWTKFALLDAEDLDNSTPNDTNNICIYTSEIAGVTSDPYLDITISACEEPEASSTPVDFGTSTNEYANDLTFITGWTEHYESSTSVPDWVEYHYYHIPFFFWVIIASVALWFATRFFLELIIRWRS